jgi:1-deoxy-D-xylulose-5-phosphate synthase
MDAARSLEKNGLSVAVYNMRFLKPIDEVLLHEVFRRFKKIITVEDGTVVGGLGSTVLEFKNEHNYTSQVKRLGIPDRFAGQGSPEELYRMYGYDAEGIAKAVVEMVPVTMNKTVP